MSVVDTCRVPTDAEIRAVEKRLTNNRTLDLNGVKQPHRAATLLWAYLYHIHGARTCWVGRPEQAEYLGYGKNWFVCWEGGPADWAVYLCGEGNINGARYHWEGIGEPPYDPGQAHVKHLDNVGSWYFEAFHSFSLSVIQN